jgi:hypothetical protein
MYILLRGHCLPVLTFIHTPKKPIETANTRGFIVPYNFRLLFAQPKSNSKNDKSQKDLEGKNIYHRVNAP